MTSDKDKKTPPFVKAPADLTIKDLGDLDSDQHIMRFEPLVSHTMLMDAMVDILVKEHCFRHLSAMQAAAAAVALAKKRAKHGFVGDGTQTEDDIPF